MVIPQLLINFRVYDAQSNDLVGVADCELPKFEAMTETVKGAGIAGEIDVPVIGHYSSTETKLNFRTITKHAIMASMTKNQKFELRGAQQTYDAVSGEVKIVPVKCIIQGLPKSTEQGKFETGAGTDTSVTIETTYVKLIVDGEELVEIDKFNYIAKIGNTDFLADVRNALGV